MNLLVMPGLFRGGGGQCTTPTATSQHMAMLKNKQGTSGLLPHHDIHEDRQVF